MKSIKTLASLGLISALLAACSSTPLSSPTATTAEPAKAAPSASTSSPSQPQSAVAAVVVPDYLDPNSAISKDRSVFFDFDNFSVKQQYAALIERHGKYLASNPKLAIRVEGNADERGSAEYNLALGQKRADAVVKALEVYGAKDSQLEATSWGREKPRNPGHDEAAWAENRRVDLAYPSK
jgi:peptidoglycan-associated lipoprotein